MTAALSTTQRRRLKAAGYVAVQVDRGNAGWVPAADAERVAGQIDAQRADVERLVSEPPPPRGRPPKRSTAEPP